MGNEHTASVANRMTMLISAPERSYGRATVLTGNQYRTAFSRWPVFPRHFWIGQHKRWILRLCTRSSIPSMHWNCTTRRCLIDTVVVCRTPIASFGATGTVAVSTTGTRTLGTMIASSTVLRSSICRGDRRSTLLLCTVLISLTTIPLGWSSDVSGLEIKTTGVANHGPSR